MYKNNQRHKITFHFITIAEKSNEKVPTGPIFLLDKIKTL